MRRLAITGGTGFVGRHALAAAVQRGHRVRALTRRPQAAASGIDWVAGSLNDRIALAELVRGCDAVIHIAGVTNARDRRAFETANIAGVANLRQAIGALPLVHVSSLAARAPTLSRYGWSKRMGEQIARGSAGPVVTLRPPAVYGPGDTDFLALMRMARSGWVAFPKHARTAMVYAADLAAALVALAEDVAGPARSAGGVYEIDDGGTAYDAAEIADAIGAALGRRVRALAITPWALRMAAGFDTLFARLRGATPRLSFDRAGYMAHPDWSADSSALCALGLWAPQMSLPQGMAATVAAARRSGAI